MLQNPAVGPELGEPLVVALLSNWLTVSYVLCGLFAWWRRPDSRFGALMVAAGFANFISTLSWTTNDLTFTFGQGLDLLPPVLFLHVFLAFPSGRLRGPWERGLVAGAYVAAVVLQAIRMTFGGFGPNNLLEFWPNQDAALLSLRVSLLTVSAFCLAGVGRAGAPWYQWVLIALAGIFLLGGHPFPAGTLAFGCLFLAALLREWRPHAAVTSAGNQNAEAPLRSNQA